MQNVRSTLDEKINLHHTSYISENNFGKILLKCYHYRAGKCQHFGLFCHIYTYLQVFKTGNSVFSELQQKLNNFGKKHIKNHIMQQLFLGFFKPYLNILLIVQIIKNSYVPSKFCYQVQVSYKNFDPDGDTALSFEFRHYGGQRNWIIMLHSIQKTTLIQFFH